jgi:uncharacterized protein YndB with AHSA1/START domain
LEVEMMNLMATARIDIHATREEVWEALTEPALIKKYFMNADVDTDWQPGSSITWRGEYDGTAYEDKGEIVEVETGKRLQHTHFSPMSGQPDEPDNYHTLTYTLEQGGDQTTVVLTQDNNGSEAEAERSSKTWAAMLDGLKRTVEGR